MKANQAFRSADEAVSPVIGVILMVAITVVLAAVVFVLVTNLSKSPGNTAPSMGFSTDASAKKVSVISAEPGVTWDNFKIQVICTDNGVAGALTPAATFNGAALTLTTGVADPVDGTAPIAAVNVGDSFVLDCGTENASDTVELIITHKPSNTQVGTTYKFTY